MPNLRIGIIYKDLSPRSGSRRFIYKTTHRLIQQDHEVKLFTNKLDFKTCFEEYITLPYEIIPLNEKFKGRFDHFIISRDAIKLGKKAAKWKPDVVFMQYAGELWFPPYFYGIGDSIGVAYLHRIPIRKNKSRNFLNKVYYQLIDHWEKISLQKLHMVLVNSKFVVRGLKKTRVLPSKIPIEVMPLGVDHSIFYPTNEDKGFLLCLSRIHPQKNLELAIHSMNMVKSNIPLIIAGNIHNQFYYEELLNLIYKLKLSNVVKIRTNITDNEIIRLMQTCSLFLFPSLEDTFGIAVLEAMSCGKTVIACNSGGVPEVIGDSRFLLNPYPEEWANIIDMLITDSYLLKEASNKALQRSKLFSWNKTTDALLKIFDRLI